MALNSRCLGGLALVVTTSLLGIAACTRDDAGVDESMTATESIRIESTDIVVGGTPAGKICVEVAGRKNPACLDRPSSSPDLRLDRARETNVLLVVWNDEVELNDQDAERLATTEVGDVNVAVGVTANDSECVRFLGPEGPVTATVTLTEASSDSTQSAPECDV